MFFFVKRFHYMLCTNKKGKKGGPRLRSYVLTGNNEYLVVAIMVIVQCISLIYCNMMQDRHCQRYISQSVFDSAQKPSIQKFI